MDMTKIDIIVPYVDENDKEWQNDFNYYKQKELEAGIQKQSNRQAFATERTRDWDNFRYWFRGVEKNCPWVNKVFLVVQRESQLPKWLNRDNPKLRIVYHHEFIPEELLPTFSTLVIETFYYRISDLSEHFIVCNDDFYFLNNIPDTLFFEDDRFNQGFSGMRAKNWTCGNRDWEAIINNNNAFLEKYIIQKPMNEFYHYSHLPDGRIKSYEIEFMNKYYDVIYEAMSVSRFRHPKNLIPSLLYIDSMKYTGYGTINKRVYSNSKYVTLTYKTNVFDYQNCEMVCFNDTACVDDFELCKEHLLDLFRYKLHDSCSFENDNIEEKQLTTLRVCFGVPSWIPEKEPDRTLRKERLDRMFKQITDLFGDVDWLIVAQNWKDYKAPDFVKHIKIRNKPQLGILGARKELRQFFLDEHYDYLIMLDDDIILETQPDFSSKYFFEELEKHKDGFFFLQYGWSLTFCGVSRYVYSNEPMVDIDPQKGEGYEDMIWPLLLHYKYSKNEFKIRGLKFTQHKAKGEKAPSTWTGNFIKQGYSFEKMNKITKFYEHRFKEGNYLIDKKAVEDALKYYDWYKDAIFHGWVTREEYNNYMKQFD